MKNLNLIRTAIILAGVFYLSFTEKSPAKPEGGEYEVMYLEILPDEMLVFKKGEDPRKIDLYNPFTGKGSNLKNGVILRDFFQSLYDEGWEIESVVTRQSSRVDDNYILKRQK